jgi:uroporphyrinogen III methyltransferase/synthase
MARAVGTRQGGVETGKVFLVGAGPGDPGLLTMRGAEALRLADVVVYDRLVSGEILDLVPEWAERVYAGKAPGQAAIEQGSINDLLVRRAREGRQVVRLKGGDPFVFGRGGEEALACARAGVAFEIVPGVTSAVAAPAFAGIPLTHRGIAASVAIVTASGSGGRSIELGRVATAADTLVVLMAAGRLAEVCGSLIEAGRPATEPAAIIQWATTSKQRTVTSTLADLPGLAEQAGVKAPATLVVGRVVDLSAVIGWFEGDDCNESSWEGSPQPTHAEAPALSGAPALALSQPRLP